MQIPIVNEQDEIIGYKDRKDRTPTDIIRIAAIWITDENGNILLQQRKFTKKDNPGKWSQAVGGIVEKGETYEENAYKELEEELGLTNIPLVFYKKIFRESTGKSFVSLYTAQIPHDTVLIPQEDEVESTRWVSPQELRKLVSESPESFVNLIKKDVQELY